MIVVPRQSIACKTEGWRNMSMEELLIKAGVVIYGKDVGHGKFRLPTMVDARFDVYCVIKKGRNLIPSQVIIEDILNGDGCSAVSGQTEVGKEYIIGLERELSGFMSYSDINPPQKTAFPVSAENLNKLAATCDLDNWEPPSTGDQFRCPVANKPRFCTKVRDPDELNASSSQYEHRLSVMLLIALVICL